MPRAVLGTEDIAEGLKIFPDFVVLAFWWEHKTKCKTRRLFSRHKHDIEQKFHWPRFQRFKAKKSSGRTGRGLGVVLFGYHVPTMTKTVQILILNWFYPLYRARKQSQKSFMNENYSLFSILFPVSFLNYQVLKFSSSLNDLPNHKINFLTFLTIPDFLFYSFHRIQL